MRRLLLFALLGGACALPGSAEARVALQGPASTTSYCLQGTMADGSTTRRRSAAHNGLRLGTRIRIVGHPAGPNGMRRYIVRDRIGYGTTLDLWQPSCSGAIRYGRRLTRYKIGWSKP